MFSKLVAGSLIFAAPLMSQDRDWNTERSVSELSGSDTLASYMEDIIEASKLQSEISYVGGGSGAGETALVAKKQNIAAMSRAMKPEQLAKAQAAGITVVEHVIGYDGIGLFVNASNKANALTLDQIKKIYTCEITNWSSVGGQNATIDVYRRDDNSGTTDTLKSLTGLSSFGSCVKILPDAESVGRVSTTEANSISYAGLSLVQPGNRMLSIGKDASKFVTPSFDNIRTFAYPLSRKLYVYEAFGSLTSVESKLLSNILDRSVSDLLLEKHDFVTLD